MAKVTRPRVVAKQHLADVDMPEQVMLSLVDLTRSAKEHFLSFSVAVGFATLQKLLEAELTRLVGPKGKHRSDRTAYRHGGESRSVTLGGRRVEIERPRARTRDGQEVRLPTYEALAERDLLTEAALARMLAGLSSRHYEAGLEPVGADVRSRGTSRSAVSRRFIQGTRVKLAQLRSRDLGQLGILAVFIAIADHTIVVALGVDAKAAKHVLGLAEGTTENAATCQALLSDLIARGLPTDRALLFVIDGGKAIRKAIRDTYGRLAPVQRCTLHYADLRIMPTRLTEPWPVAVNALARSA
ncbi:MAG: transposase [Candidatus Limnocylindria bacterium]